MRTAMAFALCSALAAACAPGDPQFTIDGSIQDPIGGGSTGPDGGADGGDAGHDAGPDGGDAGCVGTSFNTTYVTDNCLTPGASTSATVFVDSSSCATTIVVQDGLNCSGKASTATNAFDGGCNTVLTPCTSTSLPGTITCHGSGGPCTVQICDSNDNCPP